MLLRLFLLVVLLKTPTRFGAKRARTGGIFSASYSRFFSGFSEADASPLLLLNERTMRKRAENPRLLSRPSLSLFLCFFFESAILLFSVVRKGEQV
tara:strand:+ start:89 stop:376 length:288 start_codon:yes stop_codon:yes gene_type:complete